MSETQEEYTLDLDMLTRAVEHLAQYPALGFDIQDDHAKFVISLGLGTKIVQAVTEEQMNDICHKWISRHVNQHTH